MYSDKYRTTVSCSVAVLCLALLQTTRGCDHDISSSPTSRIPVPSLSPSPSPDPDENECIYSLSERDEEKSSLPGGAMVIPGKTVKFDSISYSSTNDKWRIQALCRNPRIWLQTNMEYGSYIQINLHGYSGRTCNAYQPIFYNFDRERTLLVSLARDHTSSNSSFTLGFICPYEQQVSIATTLFNCMEVADYAMSNNDAFAELKVLESNAINVALLGGPKTPHLCEMFHLAKTHCGFLLTDGTCEGTSGRHILYSFA